MSINQARHEDLAATSNRLTGGILASDFLFWPYRDDAVAANRNSAGRILR
jgi:hypothetical protein